MTRTMPDGSRRFCYGLFTLALIASGLVGLFVAQYTTEMLSERMVLWTSAALGGNIGPLLVDVLRRVVHV